MLNNIKNKMAALGGSNKKLSTSGSYFVLFLALGAMTFFGVCTPYDRQETPIGAAAKIQGEEVSNSEFVRAYENYSQRLRQQYGDQYDPAALRVASSVMDQLIDQRILFLKASELGLGASEDQVVHWLNEMAAFRDEKGAFSEESFKNYLRSNRYTESTFLNELRRSLTVQKLRSFISQTYFVSSKSAEIEYRLKETKYDVEFIKIDPSKIKQTISKDRIDAFLADNKNEDKIKIYYEANKSQYVHEAKVKAQHILITHNASKSPADQGKNRSKEEALKLAQQIAGEAKSTADFTKLAKLRTEEPSGKTTGGDLGFFSKDEMVKPFSDAAFAMNLGEVSQPVETEFGYHIIKLTDKKDKKDLSIDMVKQEIAQKILERDGSGDLLEKLATELIEALQSSKSVDDLLKSQGLAWDKTGLFSANASYITKIGSMPEVKDAVFELKTKGDVYAKPIRSGKSYFVIRLHDRQEAGLQNLDQDKKQQLAMSSAFTEGYTSYNLFEKEARKEFEDKKMIYKNPKYLALDEQISQQ